MRQSETMLSTSGSSVEVIAVSAARLQSGAVVVADAELVLCGSPFFFAGVRCRGNRSTFWSPQRGRQRTR